MSVLISVDKTWNPESGLEGRHRRHSLASSSALAGMVGLNWLGENLRGCSVTVKAVCPAFGLATLATLREPRFSCLILGLCPCFSKDFTLLKGQYRFLTLLIGSWAEQPGAL